MTMAPATTYHREDNLLDVANFGDETYRIHPSHPFNQRQKQQEYHDLEDKLKEEEDTTVCSAFLVENSGSSVLSYNDQSANNYSNTFAACPIASDDLSVYSSFDVRKCSAQSVCTYDGCSPDDDCSTCDASIYESQSCVGRLQTTSSSLPLHPSFSNRFHGENLLMSMDFPPPLETLCEQSQTSEADESDNEDDDGDCDDDYYNEYDADLERAISDLSVKIAMIRGDVDTYALQCKKLSAGCDKEQKRAEELMRENASLRRKLEEMERQAITKAMDATRGRKVAHQIDSSAPDRIEQPRGGLVLSVRSVNFSSFDPDTDITQEMPRYYIRNDNDQQANTQEETRTESKDTTDVTTPPERNPLERFGQFLSNNLSLRRLLPGSS